MLKFILRRLFETIPVLWAIATVTFFMIRLAPGGPFTQERQVSPEIIRAMNEHYGLNDPWIVQYGRYLKNMLEGDLGPSYTYPGRTVTELIWQGFPVSLELGAYALCVAICIGLTLGLLAALRKNSLLDYSTMSVAMLGICLPTFVLGPLLSLSFGLKLGWCHVSGWTSINDKILPSLTLGLFYAAYMARLTRTGMLEVLNQDFIRAARAKGCSEFRVLTKHALRGGILPAVVFLGPAAAGLISGSFVVETIFQIPGLGRHFVNAAFNRDYTVILGTVLFYGLLIVVFNLLVDIIQAVLNPRLRQEF